MKHLIEYKKPAKLFGTSSTKTEKGEALGYTTYILYLAPYKQNTLSKNMCSHADGCENYCLFGSGRGKFTSVELARINKTNYFLANRNEFMKQIVKEISLASIKHKKANTKFCVRFNGTSDLPIENLRIENKTLLELFPDVQFYDYTKNYTRKFNNLPANYDLTFSRTAKNESKAIELLKQGINVAFVFDQLPTTYKGFKVIDGDKTDLRFLDEKNGCIVGLTYKKVNKAADLEAIESGFVISTAVAV